MARKLSFNDISKALEVAYNNAKDIKEGAVDKHLQGVNPDLFGITVMLTDGRKIEKGDVNATAPIGEIAKFPLSVALLSQNTPEELVKKSGTCGCNPCGCASKPKPHIPISRHGIRAVSAVQPQGDPDGKMDLLVNNFINLMGSEPQLDIDYYKKIVEEVNAADTINTLAAAEYTLYDDAATAIDIYLRMLAMKATTGQLATLGATIAADGRNPISGQPVFDGAIAASVVTLAAVKGPHKETRAWMMRTGLPAKSGVGGMILAILPGFGAVAAYSPTLDANGNSIKAAKAIADFAQTLGLNVFASARVEVVD